MNAAIKPAIELKGIKVLSSMSQETNCYEATLYVDGEKWASVGNAGHGGCDDCHPVAGRSHQDFIDLNARIAATFEAYQSPYGGDPIPMDIEMVCGDIVDAFIVEKEAKKVTKGKVAFFKTPPAEGTPASLYTIPLKGRPVEAGLAHVRKTYPEAVILNELEGAALVEAYKRAA